MDAIRFDQIVRSLTTRDTRRGVLGLLSTLPPLGGLAALFGEDEAAAKGRRKRRKKAHKHGKGRHKGKNKKKNTKQKCRPKSTATTCAGKCGAVKNTCKKTVDCGPCACEPPCGACEACSETFTCQPCDPCCDEVCCAQANADCHADTGACCVRDSHAQTCNERCGDVTDNCGFPVDCGPCDCNIACLACKVCDDETGDCIPDPNEEGDVCGETGQVCQADGACACEESSCPGCTTCENNGFCQACADCCDSNGDCQPGTTNTACGSSDICDVCTGQEQCQSQQCACVANCDGKLCGPDGCTGQCAPGCLANATCSGDGTACTCDFEICDSTCCAEDQLCCGAACVTGACCTSAICSSPTPICSGSHTCVGCTAAEECSAAGKGNLCCGGECVTGICCADSACPSAGAPDCVTHQCVCASNGNVPCPANQTCCASGCANLQTDPDHCGACGNDCGPGLTCQGGVCGVACGGDFCPAASEICVDDGCEMCDVTCDAVDHTCAGTALQAALTAGGTVYACPGRYTGSFTLSQAVTLIGAGEGADAASNTILDAAGNGRVVFVNSGVTVSLQGLRITGGNANGSGGIRNQGNLTLTACTVAQNTSTGIGGGIVNSNPGAITLTDCTVTENSATSGGGGIHQNSSSAITLDNSIVRRNTGGREGGGIRVAFGTLNVTNGSAITENTAAAGEGGGIYNNGGTVTLDGSTITENSAAVIGGGILNNGGTVTLDGSSRVAGNTANHGGGIYNDGGDVTLTDSDVTGNTAVFQGGGILNNNGTVTLAEGSSVTDNDPDDCVNINGGTGCPAP